MIEIKKRSNTIILVFLLISIAFFLTTISPTGAYLNFITPQTPQGIFTTVTPSNSQIPPFSANLYVLSVTTPLDAQGNPTGPNTYITQDGGTNPFMVETVTVTDYYNEQGPLNPPQTQTFTEQVESTNPNRLLEFIPTGDIPNPQGGGVYPNIGVAVVSIDPSTLTYGSGIIQNGEVLCGPLPTPITTPLPTATSLRHIADINGNYVTYTEGTPGAGYTLNLQALTNLGGAALTQLISTPVNIGALSIATNPQNPSEYHVAAFGNLFSSPSPPNPGYIYTFSSLNPGIPTQVTSFTNIFGELRIIKTPDPQRGYMLVWTRSLGTGGFFQTFTLEFMYSGPDNLFGTPDDSPLISQGPTGPFTSAFGVEWPYLVYAQTNVVTATTTLFGCNLAITPLNSPCNPFPVTNPLPAQTGGFGVATSINFIDISASGLVVYQQLLPGITTSIGSISTVQFPQTQNQINPSTVIGTGIRPKIDHLTDKIIYERQDGQLIMRSASGGFDHLIFTQLPSLSATFYYRDHDINQDTIIYTRGTGVTIPFGGGNIPQVDLDYYLTAAC